VPRQASKHVTELAALNTWSAQGAHESARATFLNSPRERNASPISTFPGIQRFGAPVGELRHQLRVMHDRAGNQMREEDHEQAISEEPKLLRFSLIGIHQKRDLGESKKMKSPGAK